MMVSSVNALSTKASSYSLASKLLGLSASLSANAVGSAKGAILLHSQSISSANSIAIGLASKAVCLGTKDSSCPCSNCRSGVSSCRDVFLVRPNEHGNILSGSFDGLSEFLYTPPSTGCQTKVLLIESLDKVTTVSSSSLLKVLEDKAVLESVLIMGTTDDYGSVPPPLRSRVVCIHVPEQEVVLNTSSKAAADVSRSARWLSHMSSSGTGCYLESRKALPAIMAGVKANDLVRSWQATCKVSKGADASVATAEVISLYLSDLLAIACTAGGFQATMTSSDREQASADALAWGVSALTSLLEDLTAAVHKRLPGQDLSSFLYRWLTKACELASKKEFRKHNSVPVLEMSGRSSAPISDDSDPVVALDGDEPFKIDFGDC